MHKDIAAGKFIKSTEIYKNSLQFLQSTKIVEVFGAVRQKFRLSFFIIVKRVTNEGENSGEKISTIFNRR